MNKRLFDCLTVWQLMKTLLSMQRKQSKQTARGEYLKAADSPSLGLSAYIPENWPRGVKNVL
jgi:hypothetical protein